MIKSGAFRYDEWGVVCPNDKCGECIDLGDESQKDNCVGTVIKCECGTSFEVEDSYR